MYTDSKECGKFMMVYFKRNVKLEIFQAYVHFLKKKSLECFTRFLYAIVTQNISSVGKSILL